MHVHELRSFYITDSLHDYVNINAQLLKNINQSGSTSLRDKHDSITKLDWQYAHNGNRHWVKEFLPHLQSKLEEIMDNLGYQKPVVHELWFQQYSKDDMHDWHVHGHNFTGVYYVELDDAPKTELIMPYDQKTIIVPEVEVGSILVFPSYVIHRAPVNRQTRKTIVSFNFDASELSSTKLDKLHEGGTMNIKDYEIEPKKPLSFEEWKGNIAPQYQGDKLKAYDRLHKVDYQKEFDEMLKREYAEYCDNLNGNWLLR